MNHGCDEFVEVFGKRISLSEAARLCLWMHDQYDFLKPLTEEEVDLLQQQAAFQAQDI